MLDDRTPVNLGNKFHTPQNIALPSHPSKAVDVKVLVFI